MLLWLTLCAFQKSLKPFELIIVKPNRYRLSKCCCGLRSDIEFENVAVTIVLVTLSLKMLLWRTFCALQTSRKPFELTIVTPNSYRLSKCCRGQRSSDIEFENVAVAIILVTLSLKMLLWLTFCAFQTSCKPFELTIVTPNSYQLSKCCRGQRSGDIEFENVAVAIVLVT